MAKSDSILGRAPNRRAFKAGKPFRVSVYMYEGKARYTDPIRERYCAANPSVRYRLIIRRKRCALPTG